MNAAMLMTPATTTLGERLKGLRMNSQKTLKEQGDIFGVSVNSVYRWEHDLAVPRKSSLERVVRFYEVSLEWLLTGDSAEGLGENGSDDEEKHLLKMYRRLSGNDKYKILGYIERIYVENMEEHPADRNLGKPRAITL